MSLVRPLPETDGLAAHYWASAANEKLVIQRCDSCAQYQHYGRLMCVHCGAGTLQWVDTQGEGAVLSCTTVYRSPYSDVQTPYTLALIRLDEGVTLLSHLLGGDAGGNYCDARVQLEFSPLRDGFKLPVFRLLESGEPA